MLVLNWERYLLLNSKCPDRLFKCFFLVFGWLALSFYRWLLLILVCRVHWNRSALVLIYLVFGRWRHLNYYGGLAAGDLLCLDQVLQGYLRVLTLLEAWFWVNLSLLAFRKGEALACDLRSEVHISHLKRFLGMHLLQSLLVFNLILRRFFNSLPFDQFLGSKLLGSSC